MQTIYFVKDSLNLKKEEKQKKKISKVSSLKFIPSSINWKLNSNCLKKPILKSSVYACTLRSGYTNSSVPEAALSFITQHGRMKYNRPIYREFYKLSGEFRQLAIETFQKHFNFYHPIASAMIQKDLKLKCL
jgi:hypothetical protein